MSAPPLRSIVTVDGIDGSGKSIFARRLVAALGPRALLLAVDDFRRPVDWPVPGEVSGPSELDVYYHRRYDLEALDHALIAYNEGAPAASYRSFDRASEVLGEERIISFHARSYLVVEGVFVARLRSITDALNIFLDVPRAEARSRILARDLAKGRSEAEVLRRIDQRYFPAHDRYLAEQLPRDRAAVLVSNVDPERPQLLRAQLRPGAGWAPVNAAVDAVVGADPRT